MELVYLVLGVLGLVLVTLVGHGLWLLCAALFRTFGQDFALDARACPRCRQPLRRWEQTCPACQAAEGELRELEATERQLKTFQATEVLDRATWERFQQWIEARRRDLRPGKSADAPRSRPLPRPQPTDSPLVESLERLLAPCTDERRLDPRDRGQALWSYRQLSEQERRRLSVPVQLTLARLLRLVGEVDEALDCYRRLLLSHPRHTWAGPVAFEAGRFAERRHRSEEARWFLERAARSDLPESEQSEAEALLQRLPLPEQGSILEALPDEKRLPDQDTPAVLAPAVPEPLAETPAPPRLSPHPLPVATPSRRPRKTLAEMLAAFMEERNIFWGELVGGLLIVGCSIALVISLWATLQQVPFFPFLVFAGITAALFGAGLYTLHHWKLQATSRGLLLIATLLVPLNFLVLAGLTSAPSHEGLGWLVPASLETAALAVFAVLLRQAAAVLTPQGRGALTVAVLGNSAGQLLAPYLLAGALPAPLVLLGAWAVACHGGATAVFLVRVRRRALAEGDGLLSPLQAHAVFSFLGLASFALLVALGLLVHLGGDTALALQRLAVLIALAGGVVLAAGLLVHVRAPASALPPTPSPPGPDIAGEGRQTSLPTGVWRAAGTATALGGTLVLLLAVVLAWPEPVAVLLVSAFDVALLTFVAFRYRLYPAHVPALACLALGYLAAFHLLLGPGGADGPGLAEQSLSAGRGAALAGLVVVLVLLSEGLCRLGLRLHGACYAAGAAAVALVSLVLVLALGLDLALQNAAVCGLYAFLTLALNCRWRRPLLGYVGLTLVLGTTLCLLEFGCPDNQPVWGLVVAGEALVLAGAAVLLGSRRLTLVGLVREETTGPVWTSVPAAACRDLAAAASILALALALGSSNFAPGGWHTWTAAVLAATMFLLAWPYRLVPLSWVGSLLLLACLGQALAFDLGALPRPWLAALLLHASLTFAAGLGMAGLRRPLLRQLYGQPLEQSALLASLAAAPLLYPRTAAEMVPLALYAGWLAVVWLVLSWTWRRPLLFAACEAALSAAVLFAVTAWLAGQPWVDERFPEGLGDPRSLQAYATGLAGLGLLWVALRIGLSRWTALQEFVDSEWPVGWRLMVGGVVLLGQLALAAWGLLPGVAGELSPASAALPNLGDLLRQHSVAYGPGAWVLLGLLGAVLLAGLWEPCAPRWRFGLFPGLVLVAVTVPLLAAGWFADTLAAASALRWGLAACFLIVSAFLWARAPLARWAERLHVPPFSPEDMSALARRLLLCLTVLPVLLLTAMVAADGFQGVQPAGPVAELVFARMGWTGANLVPLVLLSVGLVGHALRERSPGYAFAAGLLADASLVGGYALLLVAGRGRLSGAQQVLLLQLGTAGAAVWAIGWLLSRRWVAAWREVPTDGMRPPASARPLMLLQVGLSLAGNVVLLGLPVLRLLATPGTGLPPELLACGEAWGWLALVLALAAAFLHAGRASPSLLTALGLGVSILAAVAVNRWDQSTWSSYHVLLVGWTLTAVLLAVGKRTLGWVWGVGLLVLVLAVRATWDDPLRPYWSAGTTLVLAGLVGTLAVRRRQSGLVPVSGLLLNVAGAMLWVGWGEATLSALGYTQVLCLALGAGAWTILERVLRQVRDGSPVFAHFGVILALVLLGLLLTPTVAADLTGTRSAAVSALAWTAWLATSAACALGLWDADARFTPAGLYAAGILGIALGLHHLGLAPVSFTCSATLALAAYALLASAVAWLCSHRPGLVQGLRLATSGWQGRWFVPVETGVAALVTLGTVGLALTLGTFLERGSGPLALALLLPAGVLLADLGRGTQRAGWRLATLALGVLLVAEVGWAALGREFPSLWLHRSVLLLLALALMTWVDGMGLARGLRRFPDWAESARQLGPVLGVLAALLLLLVLVQEGALYQAELKRTPMTVWAVVVVAGGLGGLVAAALIFALVPGRDPLGLSERGRMLYVYAAEVLLVLLLLHARLAVPELFGPVGSKYWTFIVMAVAFAGVGLSEAFKRRGLPVLAEPLQWTGVFLPLLPLAAFWIKPPAALQEFAHDHAPGLLPLLGYLDRVPQHFGQYALLFPGDAPAGSADEELDHPGEGEAQQAQQNVGLKAQLGEADVEPTRAAEEDEELQQNGHPTAGGGRHRGSGHAQVRKRSQPEDQARVEHQVDGVGQPEYAHGNGGVASAAEGPIEQEEEEDDHVAAEHDGGKGSAQLDHLRVGPHEGQQTRGMKGAEHSQDARDHEAQEEGLDGHHGRPLSIALPHAPCDRGRHSDAQSHGHRVHDAQQRFRQSHGGHRRGAEFGDEEDVYQGEEGLHHHLQDHGDGQEQNGTRDAPLGRVSPAAPERIAHHLQPAGEDRSQATLRVRHPSLLLTNGWSVDRHGTTLAESLSRGRPPFLAGPGRVADEEEDMPFVKCGVNGCNQRLQPILKVDPRDRDTWLYPECDVCGRPACEKHSSEFAGQVVCDRCRQEIEARQATPPLIDLGIRLPGGSTER